MESKLVDLTGIFHNEGNLPQIVSLLYSLLDSVDKNYWTDWIFIDCTFNTPALKRRLLYLFLHVGTERGTASLPIWMKPEKYRGSEFDRIPDSQQPNMNGRLCWTCRRKRSESESILLDVQSVIAFFEVLAWGRKSMTFVERLFIFLGRHKEASSRPHDVICVRPVFFWAMFFSIGFPVLRS